MDGAQLVVDLLKVAAGAPSSKVSKPAKKSNPFVVSFKVLGVHTYHETYGRHGAIEWVEKAAGEGIAPIYVKAPNGKVYCRDKQGAWSFVK